MSCNMSVCSLVLNFLHGCTQYSVLQTYNEISFAQKYIYSVYFYMENLYNSPFLHQKPRLFVQMTFSWGFFDFFYLHLYTDQQFFQRVKEEAEIHTVNPTSLFFIHVYASRGGSKAI